MTELFFAPASKRDDDDENWTPYDNFNKTVQSPVVEPELYGLPMEYIIAAVWGITDGVAYDFGERIEQENYIVFYTGNGEYPFIGKVREYLPNRRETAIELWPAFTQDDSGNAPNEPWSNLIILESVWSADIPAEEVLHWRRSSDDVVRRFSGVPVNRRRRMERDHEPVEEWVQQRRKTLISATLGSDIVRNPNLPIHKLRSDTQILGYLASILGYETNDISDSLQATLIHAFKSFHGL